MSDLISREDAIDALAYFDEKDPLGHTPQQIIMALPSVQPQRMRGKWIGGELGRCSVCGHEGNASDIWNGCKGMFCPNCGADMRGTE